MIQIISSDDGPSSPALPREHGALHPAVYSRCGDRVPGRDRPRPGQQQPGDPECAGSEALHISGQRAFAALGRAGLSQSAVRTRCRAVVFEVIPGAVRRPNYGGNCALEVGDRDLGVEDADGDIVPGVFSFGSHTVCRACGE